MEFRTIHEMYRHWFETRSPLAAYYRRVGGRWEPVSWGVLGERVAHFAMGLMALGMEHRDRVALSSRAREEWEVADKGVLAAGGVTVGCDPSWDLGRLRHVLLDSEARFLILENRRQWEQVQKIRGELPGLKRCVVIDPGGPGEGAVPFSHVLHLGKEEEPRCGEVLADRCAASGPDDLAVLSYSFGGEGTPKGLMHSHGNLLAACRSVRDLGLFSAQDVILVGFPMHAVHGRILRMAGAWSGATGYLAEDPAAAVDGPETVRPTILCGPSRFFEETHARAVAGIDRAAWFRRQLFRWAFRVGAGRSRHLQAGRNPPLLLRARFRLAEALALGTVRGALGGKVRIILVHGPVLSEELVGFFHAAGILPLQGFGVPEASVCTANRVEAYRFGSVGRPVPGVQVRTAEDGEILVKSGMVFRGYLNDPEGTRRAFTEDGWLATGTAGRIDPEGFLWITGRKAAP